VVRVVTIGGSILGAAALGIGLALLLTAPSEDSIDEGAHAEGLRVVPFVGDRAAGIAGVF